MSECKPELQPLPGGEAYPVYDQNMEQTVEYVAWLQYRLSELEKREDEFWWMLGNHFEIESREELEELAQGWHPSNALMVAVHQIWKRDPIVSQLKSERDALKATLGLVKQWNGAVHTLDRDPLKVVAHLVKQFDELDSILSTASTTIAEKGRE